MSPLIQGVPWPALQAAQPTERPLFGRHDESTGLVVSGLSPRGDGDACGVEPHAYRHSGPARERPSARPEKAANYRLRIATPADEAWQLAIYAGTRADEMALTGWPAEQCAQFVAMQHRAQQQHYGQHFPASVCWLILVGEEVAGRLWVDSRAASLHVLDIALLPAWRGQGLGTRCLQALAREADAGRRSLSIQVEIHNPARRLYERLGFVAEGESQGLYQAMRRPAPSPEECLP